MANVLLFYQHVVQSVCVCLGKILFSKLNWTLAPVSLPTVYFLLLLLLPHELSKQIEKKWMNKIENWIEFAGNRFTRTKKLNGGVRNGKRRRKKTTKTQREQIEWTDTKMNKECAMRRLNWRRKRYRGWKQTWQARARERERGRRARNIKNSAQEHENCFFYRNKNTTVGFYSHVIYF